MSPAPAGRARLRVPFSLAFSLEKSGRVALGADASAYVTRVHRLGVGDRFVAFDPELALEAEALLVEVSKRDAFVELEAPRPAQVRAVRPTTLVQATCKGDKMDAVVRDATELGATRIIAAVSARSISRPDEARADRWRRIAVEAARQCGRGDVPAVEGPLPLPRALARALEADGAIAAFCLDPRATTALGARLPLLDPLGPVAFAVGPEGGFDDDELLAAEAAGFTRASVGPLVLRTETVCAAVLGALLLQATGAPTR